MRAISAFLRRASGSPPARLRRDIRRVQPYPERPQGKTLEKGLKRPKKKTKKCGKMAEKLASTRSQVALRDQKNLSKSFSR
jgi:hypothetical protein